MAKKTLIQLFTIAKVRRGNRTKCDADRGYFHVWSWEEDNDQPPTQERVPVGLKCQCGLMTMNEKPNIRAVN